MAGSGAAPLTVKDVGTLLRQSGQGKQLNWSNELGEMLRIDGSRVTPASWPGAGGGTTSVVMAAFPRKLDWPAGFTNVAGYAEALRGEYNLRLDQAVFAGGTALVSGQFVGILTHWG